MKAWPEKRFLNDAHEDVVFPFIEELALETGRSIIFQQDGVPSQAFLKVRQSFPREVDRTRGTCSVARTIFRLDSARFLGVERPRFQGLFLDSRGRYSMRK